MSTTSVSQRLEKALQKIDRPGSFCMEGCTAAVLPGLEIDDLGTVAFPLTASQAEQIKEKCTQAPYGKGEKTIVDTSVRRVWQLQPDRFQLCNPEWNQFLSQTVKKVQAELGLEKQKLESHLYNLLLYEKGSFFLPHQDGEKLRRMVATLVVMLPSVYQGGKLVVRHEGQEKIIAFGGKGSSFQIHFAAFYADCEHEVRPLRAGYRLCLVYNLTLAKAKKALTAPNSAEHIAEVGALLRNWSSETAASPAKLAITLEHEYTQAGLQWDALKGVDRAKAKVLREAARQTDCMAYLATLTFWEAGSAEGGEESYYGGNRGYYYQDYEDEDEGEEDGDNAGDYEMGEVFDSSLTAEHWTDDDGHRLDLGNMTVEEDEVVPRDSLRDVKPEEEFEGYTGNAGMTLDRWYRHAAVFLWPEKRHFEVLCAAGADKAVAALELLVKKWHKAAKKNQANLREQCAEFARQIIAHWPHNPHGRGFGEKRQTCPLVPVLVLLGDAALLRAFLGQVMLQDVSAESSAALLKACEKHGWPTFRKEVAAIIQGSSFASLERNVHLLEQFCAAGLQKKKEWSEMCRSLAAQALSILEELDTKDTWQARDVKRSEVLAGLVRFLLGSNQDDLLPRLLEHVQAKPEYYPLRPVQIEALVRLEPWLREHITKPCAALSAWLAACRSELASLPTPAEPSDFRRPAPITCKCKDCSELREFLKNPQEKVHRFSVGKDRRRHLHNMIEQHQCDLTHVTDRRGSPQTLVCTKTTASFKRNTKEHQANQEHLAALNAIAAKLPGSRRRTALTR